jgi:peptidyl-prolyl cis-trans isomerase B (cyclophilin B)
VKRAIAITTSLLVVSVAILSPAQAGDKVKPKGVIARAMRSVVSGCKATTATSRPATKFSIPSYKAPADQVTFTFKTNCGDIVVQADGKNAPVTVFIFAVMANAGYFDKTLCHRLTTAGLYVLQCGDPTATGRGGPNFTFRDENLPAATANNYPAGTVAMANSGPDTNGSQFFLVYSDTTLGPSYTRWGKITKGLDILKAIAAAGNIVVGSNKEYPRQTVAIESVSVK